MHDNNASPYILTDEVLDEAINKLNVGIGSDLVHSNHLKRIGKKCRKLLLAFFNKFLVHAYLPKDWLRGDIRPILKKGKVCRTLSSNYTGQQRKKRSSNT